MLTRLQTIIKTRSVLSLTRRAISTETPTEGSQSAESAKTNSEELVAQQQTHETETNLKRQGKREQRESFSVAESEQSESFIRSRGHERDRGSDDQKKLQRQPEEELPNDFDMQEFQQFKSDKMEEQLQTLQKLELYRESLKFIDILKEKLANEKPEHQQYLINRLKETDSPYNNFVVKGVQSQSLLRESTKRNMLKQVVNNQEKQQNQPFDSVLVGNAPFSQNQFQPTNTIDVAPYHKERKVINYTEYQILKEEQLEQQDWRINFDVMDKKDEDKMDLKEEGQEILAEEAFEENQDALNRSDLSFEQRKSLDEQEGDDMLEILGLNNEASFCEMREDVRQMKGSVAPENSLPLDRPSLDLERDLQYETAKKLRNGLMYDPSAGMNTIQNIIGSQNEELSAAMQMPKYANDQPDVKIDRSYIQTLQSEFRIIESIKKINEELHDLVESKLGKVKGKLFRVSAERDSLIHEMTRKIKAQTENQAEHVAPFDFLTTQINISNKQSQVVKDHQVKQWQVELKNNSFDPQSKSVEMYEKELLLISKIALVKENLETSLKRFEFVFDCMKKNHIQSTDQIKARIFEYGHLNQSFELTCSMLKQLTKVDESYIDPRYLKQYFELSIKQDNFDGIAYLVNYTNHHGVGIGSWNLSAFRKAMDYYINTNFNLNKVMIFMKFYTSFYNDRRAQLLESSAILFSEEADPKLASQAIFDQHDELIDMRSLFSYLVDKVGSEQLVDTFTKEDAIWNLIDFYTSDPHFFKISQESEFNTIEVDQIAKYLGNQIQRPSSIDRVFKVALRLDQVNQSSAFNQSILRYLRDYETINNGRLPMSFQKSQVKKIYTNLRASKNLQIKGSTSELLLFVMKAAKLNDEIIDFCTFDTDCPIKQFYMAEALMQMELQKGSSYTKVLQKAKVIPESGELTPCQLTQATKALFLDKGAKDAVRFFEERSHSIKQEDHARKHLLVSMYDSVFKKNSDVSFDEFKKIYLRSSIISQQVARESYAVAQLQRVIQDKDYEQVESLLSMYALLKEEKQLRDETTRLKIDIKKDPVYSEKINNVMHRRKICQSKLADKDVKILTQIQQALQGQKLTLLTNQTAATVEHYLNIFKDMKYEDLEDMESRNLALTTSDEESSGKELSSDSSSDEELQFENSDEEREYYELIKYDASDEIGVQRILSEFQQIFAETVKSLDKVIENKERDMEEIEEEWDENRLIDKYNKMRQEDLKPSHEYENEDEDRFSIQYHQTKELDEPIEIEGEEDLRDPNILIAEAYDMSMLEMKEHLLQALTERKKKVLPIALQIFNKVQDKNFTTQRIEEYTPYNEQSIDMSKFDSNLDKLRFLILGESSPIQSFLNQTKLVMSETSDEHTIESKFDDYYKNDDDLLEPLDIDHYQRHQEKLQGLVSQLDSINQTLNQMKVKIQDQSLLNQKSELRGVNQKFKTKHKQLVESLYQKFKEQISTQVSQEQKIAFMREVLALHLGDKFTSGSFPTFYALDLISFGIERKKPDAIRLGERILEEQAAKMPKPLATAVRYFMLNEQNQNSYRKGIQFGSLVGSNNLYHSVDVASPLYCMDDPYWQEFMAKNSRREDIWRTPSMLAWNHKQYGVIGEVVDTDRMRQQFEKYARDLF